MTQQNRDSSSIHNFDFNLICEYFSLLERQGPGSNSTTRLALQLLRDLPEKPQFADLGCGSGASTLVLAQTANVHIVALDLFPQFIEKLNERAQREGLDNRIDGITGNMEALPFDNEQFDVIWSEGAIYNIGFERGLREWKPFIRKGGYLVVSESSWLTDKRPYEIEQFWNDAYDKMDTVAHKVEQMQAAGYVCEAHVLLPNNCWTDNFYIPQQKIQSEFLKYHPNDPFAQELIMNQRREAEMYDKYKKYYGYVFYIGRVQ